MENLVVWWRWRRVGVRWILHLVERRSLPLFLLAKDVDNGIFVPDGVSRFPTGL
jgi:hypothetical protein